MVLLVVVSSYVCRGRTSYSVFFLSLSADTNRYGLPAGQGAPDTTFHVCLMAWLDQYKLIALQAQAVALTDSKR
jgi:hypothetical protein